MTTAVLDEPTLTDTRPRLEVLKASQMILRGQESLYAALLREAEADVQHQNFQVFAPFSREQLVRIQARTALRKALDEIYHHVVKIRPGRPICRRMR